jgi:hypothetical protein
MVGNTSGLKRGGFRKGVSGNPGGRPKALVEVTAAARTHTMEAIVTLREVMRNAKTTSAARVNAAIALLDRGWGKAPQNLNIKHDMNLSELSDAELIGIIIDERQERAERHANAGGDTVPTPVDKTQLN